MGFPMRELLSQALAAADTDSDCLQSGVVRRTYTVGSSRNKTNPTRRILSFASLSNWLAPTDIQLGQACTSVAVPGCRHPAPRDQSLPLARRRSCRCPQCSVLVPSCGLCTTAVSIASEHVLIEACEVKRVCKRPTKRISGADNPSEHTYVHTCIGSRLTGGPVAQNSST